jgi:chromosome segregation ATPase
MSEGSTPQGFPPYQPAPPPHNSGSGAKIPILFGIVIALVAANVYLFVELRNVRTEMVTMRDSLLDEVTKVREAHSLSAQTNRHTIDTLRDQLEAQRRQMSMATGEARAEAEKKVAETEKRLQAAQAEQARIFDSKVSAVRQEADTANTKIEAVGTDVAGVKTDVASTKSELERTVADLKRVNGELTGQGSLIATNGKELDALRSLGERNYFQFTLPRGKAPQKVGDVMIELKKTDPKRNRYTIEITADDKKTEKKDRTINEPLQFYTSKARQPYEIVVNDVQKNQIVGYLATPKVQSGR